MALIVSIVLISTATQQSVFYKSQPITHQHQKIQGQCIWLEHVMRCITLGHQDHFVCPQTFTRTLLPLHFYTLLPLQH